MTRNKAQHNEAKSAPNPRQTALHITRGVYALRQLRMIPTDEDMADLQADGYLGEVLQVLRAGQGDASAGVQAEALSILAGMMLERVAQGGQA